MGTQLTLHTGGNWAGTCRPSAISSTSAPTISTRYLYQSDAESVAGPGARRPRRPGRRRPPGYQIKNLTPLGYSARSRAVHRHRLRRLQLRPGLQGQPGLRRARTRASASSTSPTRRTRSQLLNYTGCNVGQGDVVVYGNILVRSWDSGRANARRSTCAGQAVGDGFEGIHIFDISNPAAPVMVKQLRMASPDNEPGGPRRLRLAHRDRRAGPRARRPVHLQRRLERHLPGHRHRPDQDLADPTDATFLQPRRARPRRATPATTTTC